MLRRLILFGIMALGVLGGTTGQGTFAMFTSAGSSSANSFTAGTLNLTAGTTTGTLSVNNLLAGDFYVAQLTIVSSGSLGLVYSMTSSTSGSGVLGGTLMLTIRTKTANPCTAQDGMVLYPTGIQTGTLSTAAFGNPSQGVNTGDRTLAAGASEALCFTVSLPASATSTLQGTSATTTFSFAAEQQ